MDDEAKFSLKEKRFINAYLGAAQGNASEAARIAGYKDGGEFGYRLLKKVEIRAHIDDVLMAEAMTPAEILHELRDVATAEWRDFITVRTNPKTGDVIEVKMDLAAKMKALELNGKYHNMYTESVNLSGNVVIVREYREGAPKERDDDGRDHGL
jgi:phage terminase small subunit